MGKNPTNPFPIPLNQPGPQMVKIEHLMIPNRPPNRFEGDVVMAISVLVHGSQSRSKQRTQAMVSFAVTPPKAKARRSNHPTAAGGGTTTERHLRGSFFLHLGYLPHSSTPPIRIDLAATDMSLPPAVGLGSGRGDVPSTPTAGLGSGWAAVPVEAGSRTWIWSGCCHVLEG